MSKKKTVSNLTDEQYRFFQTIRYACTTDREAGQPWLRRAFARITPVYAPGSKTMGITRNYICYIDFDHMFQLGPQVAAKFLNHEVWHPLLRHFDKTYPDPPRWVNKQTLMNIAQDLEINDGIKSIAPEFALFPGEKMFSSLPPDSTSELYYDAILENIHKYVPYFPQLANLPGFPQQDKGDGENGESQEEEEGLPAPTIVFKISACPDMNCTAHHRFGTPIPTSRKSPDFQPLLEPRVYDYVVQVMTMASGLGVTKWVEGKPVLLKEALRVMQLFSGVDDKHLLTALSIDGLDADSDPSLLKGATGCKHALPEDFGAAVLVAVTPPGSDNPDEGESGESSDEEGGDGESSGDSDNNEENSDSDESENGESSSKGSPSPESHFQGACGSTPEAEAEFDFDVDADVLPSTEELDSLIEKVSEDVLSDASAKGVGSGESTMSSKVSEWGKKNRPVRTTDWKQQLRSRFFSNSQLQRGRRLPVRHRPSRRTGMNRKIILPGYQQPVVTLGVGVDVSGSNVGNLTVCLDVFMDIVRSSVVKKNNIRAFAVDVRASAEKIVKDPRELLDGLPIGGGTRMTPGYEKLADMEESVSVLFTDGYVYDYPKNMPLTSNNRIPKTKFITCIMVDSAKTQEEADKSEQYLKAVKLISAWSDVIAIPAAALS